MATNLRFRRNISKVFTIIIIWIIIGIFIAFFEHTVLETMSSIADMENNPDINLWVSIKTYILGAALGGLTVGIIEFFYLRDATRNFSFGKLLLIKSSIYLIVILLLNVIASLFYNSSNLGLSPFHPVVVDNSIKFLLNYGLVRNVITWTSITAATLIFLMINDKFGPGQMLKIILGRYNKPQEEDRIFMFLDMKSSTTIAEKLGHLNYFNLLKDFFADITNDIEDRKGEIYQYVGDEIVVSWTMQNGITNANCLQCFYDIQKTIEKLSPKYLDKYGLVPGFKAGYHYGNVTTGEIGVIKKEIVFSGDVINTTARIQDQCNQYGVRILLSKRLYDMLPKLNTLSFEEIGDFQLRGKETYVQLFTVTQVDLTKVNIKSEEAMAQ